MEQSTHKRVTLRWWVGLMAGCLAATGHALDLPEAYRKAEANDPNFAVSLRRAEADAAGVEVARSRLLPSLSFSASAGQAKTDTEYLSGLYKGRIVENSYQTRNWSLSARQPLYRPSDWAGWQRAEAQAKASAQIIEGSRVKLLQQVVRAYAQSLAAAAQRDVAQKEVDRFTAVLHQAKRGFELGTATRTDVEEAQARLDAAAANVWQQEAKLAQALAALTALIGDPVAIEALRPLSAVAPLAERALNRPLAEWIAAAQANHPEVLALLAQEEAARRAVEQQRGQHLPTVDLVAARRMSRSDSETTIGQQFDTTSVAVQLQVPLYAGGGIDASVRAALAALAEAQLRTEAKRRELAQTLTQSYTALRFGLEQWRALAQAERSAEQAVIGTEKGIAAGTRNSVDLLNAQQELAKVRANRIDVAYQMLIAALDLYSSGERGVSVVLDELAAAARSQEPMLAETAPARPGRSFSSP